MIPKKKKEHEPLPMELCHNYNTCSRNICPLDPDKNSLPYVAGDEKCRATKPTRMKIAAQFPELLPGKGLTNRELSGQRTWANRSPKEKKKFLKSSAKSLKAINKNKSIGGKL